MSHWRTASSSQHSGSPETPRASPGVGSEGVVDYSGGLTGKTVFNVSQALLLICSL